MSTVNPYVFKPGIHSYNARRRSEAAIAKPPGGINKLRLLLFIAGLCCLGYYAYTVADQRIYQVYENWAFDQEIAGHPAVTFKDYIRSLAGEKEATQHVQPPPPSPAAPAYGSVIGRVSIGRLDLSAVVRQGVDADTFKVAVGHVPSTALPGQTGNFAIAAHRDTLFRALKDIRKGDLVTFQSPTAIFNYQVVATKIVKPTDVSVLQPNGGGLVQNPHKLLTMITCYPFYYVGSAPKRFIVEAELVNAAK